MKVVDMHCDTIGELWKAEKAGKPISLRSNSLHIDLEKMQKGDYLLQNFAMFVFLGREKDPLVNVLEMIDVYNRAMAEMPTSSGRCSNTRTSRRTAPPGSCPVC